MGKLKDFFKWRRCLKLKPLYMTSYGTFERLLREERAMRLEDFRKASSAYRGMVDCRIDDYLSSLWALYEESVNVQTYDEWELLQRHGWMAEDPVKTALEKQKRHHRSQKRKNRVFL